MVLSIYLKIKAVKRKPNLAEAVNEARQGARAQCTYLHQVERWRALSGSDTIII